MANVENPIRFDVNTQSCENPYLSSVKPDPYFLAVEAKLRDNPDQWSLDNPHLFQSLSQEIHDRGLSLEHWESILELESKLARYARLVVEGKVEGISSVHRQYLGYHDWDWPVSIPSDREPDSPLYPEIVAYGRIEKVKQYTLDDYPWKRESLKLHLESTYVVGRISGGQDRRIEFVNGQWSHITHPVRNPLISRSVTDSEMDLILKECLLLRSEVENPMTKNVADLQLVARTQLEESVLIERLARKVFSGFAELKIERVVGWRKPIPQAA